MSEIKPLWRVIMLSPEPGVLAVPEPVEIRAHMCNAQDDGTLLFRDARGLTKVIIAADLWQRVEREENE